MKRGVDFVVEGRGNEKLFQHLRAGKRCFEVCLGKVEGKKCLSPVPEI